MHYHDPDQPDRLFRSIGALDAYRDAHDGEPESIGFCIDEQCLRRPAPRERADRQGELAPSD
jgi:hypothetical protein